MSIRDDYTDDEWDQLTEEEQKGLLLMDADEKGEETDDDIDDDADGDDDDMSDSARLAANDAKEAARKEQEEAEAGDGGEDDAGKGKKKEPGAEGDDDGDDKKGKDGKDDAGEGDAGQGEGDQGDAGDDDTASAKPLPKGWGAELPKDHDMKVADNETAQNANEKAYEDGDISFAEYRKEQRRLDKEAHALQKLADDVELDRKLAHEKVVGQWQGLMDTFIPAHPELSKTKTRMNVFDTILQRVTAETIGKGKMPGTADVNKAYKEWCAEFDVEPEAASSDGKGKGKAAPAKPKKKAPPVLGGMPAAQGNDAADGRFAQLDRLSGDAFEDALAKLSPADRDAYLQGA